MSELKVKKKKKPIKISQNELHLGEYIKKVLKVVHPDLQLTESAKIILEDINEYILKQIFISLRNLVSRLKVETINIQHIQDAIKLTLPGELANYAIREGTKAVSKENISHAKQEGIKVPKRQTKSLRSGLKFPPTRIKSVVKSEFNMRVGENVGVYLAGVLEYITSEFVELAGHATKESKKKKINPQFLNIAILNDDELSKLLKNTIRPCVAMPYINPILLSKKK